MAYVYVDPTYRSFLKKYMNKCIPLKKLGELPKDMFYNLYPSFIFMLMIYSTTRFSKVSRTGTHVKSLER